MKGPGHVSRPANVLPDPGTRMPGAAWARRPQVMGPSFPGDGWEDQRRRRRQVCS